MNLVSFNNATHLQFQRPTDCERYRRDNPRPKAAAPPLGGTSACDSRESAVRCQATPDCASSEVSCKRQPGGLKPVPVRRSLGKENKIMEINDWPIDIAESWLREATWKAIRGL
jgi:hypothetical protein